MIRCDKCSTQAIIFQKYSGMHLCVDHFDDDVLRKVRETLRETKIFGRGAKIAIGISGSQDSSAMMYILKNLFARRRDIELVAVLVDEGICGYRSETISAAIALADRLDIPKITCSFKEAFGVTTDEIASQDRLRAPCTFCRAMRDALLNRTALEIGASVLSLGHNLDDMAEIVMDKCLCGDPSSLSRLQVPYLPSEVVPVIRPLMRVPRAEVALYARTHNLSPYASGSCPYLGEAIRLAVKTALNDFEQKHPGTKYSLLRSFERIIKLQDKALTTKQVAGAKPLSGGGEKEGEREPR